MTAYTSATAVAPAAGDNYSAQEGCFEGPEKLLELWFSPSPHKLWRVSRVRGDNSLPPSPIETDSDVSELSSLDGSYMEQDVPSYADFKANQLLKYDGAGLRVVPKPVWDEMLAIVRCTVLNTIRNDYVDAYLLRWIINI
ncbi:hypothetical protein BC937DRAFT_95302 [Endogone sp. FLAS-F59071]|nr:hypothetical protein BC937DRAFT_95302 [Endogone sp. FLAS-F59071]|eukprot:RUS20401.1 hypothetical protein BC937DRAFT_95302 [Endogone sp. FLAS-F59071]